MRNLCLLPLILILSGAAAGQSRRSSSSAESDRIACNADLRWLNTNGNLSYSKSLQLPISTSLLAYVSKTEDCSGAEIALTATYLTDNQDFICSGTMRQAMSMASEVQAFNVEIRPFNQLDYLRWRNEPGIRGVKQGKPLSCLNLDASSDLPDMERQKAGWIRVSFGLLPAGGGLSIAEGIVRIIP